MDADFFYFFFILMQIGKDGSQKKSETEPSFQVSFYFPFISVCLLTIWYP